MREIKFRAWHKESKEMFYDGGRHVFQWKHDGQPVIIEQFTGLLDKNGKEIYEGDILMIRSPERNCQTHTGDNILLGSYTEPMEPIIKVEKQTVVFHGGAFTLSDSKAVDFMGDDQSMPLSWLCIEYDLELSKECFLGGWGNYKNQFQWDGEDGDLGYLLDEYCLETEKELVGYLGAEVIGNIHENPELCPTQNK
jgi:hypothetical protein